MIGGEKDECNENGCKTKHLFRNEGVEEIRKVLLSLKEKGKLIILASHSKEDIQILCDTVFRMDHGKIIATETN